MLDGMIDLDFGRCEKMFLNRGDGLKRDKRPVAFVGLNDVPLNGISCEQLSEELI